MPYKDKEKKKAAANRAWRAANADKVKATRLRRNPPHRVPITDVKLRKDGVEVVRPGFISLENLKLYVRQLENK